MSRRTAAATARSNPRSDAFTLVELLLALMIFALVMASASAAFWSVMKAWNRGEDLLGRLHHGEYAMEQLAGALRGAAWFPSKPEAFGFRLDASGGSSPSAANEFSFVTGLHRLSVTVEGRGDKRGLVVRAWPHLALETEAKDVEAFLVAPGVEGLSCEWYDFEQESWSQEWEMTNSLPKLVRLTIAMQPREGERDGLVFRRLVELEVAPPLPGRERNSRQRAERDEDDAEDSDGDSRPSGDSGRPGHSGSPGNSGSTGSSGRSGSPAGGTGQIGFRPGGEHL